jgi:hypothetical protein
MSFCCAVKLSIVMPNGTLLGVVILCIVLQNAVMLSIVMRCVIMLSAEMLNVVMQSVVMARVIALSTARLCKGLMRILRIIFTLSKHFALEGCIPLSGAAAARSATDGLFTLQWFLRHEINTTLLLWSYSQRFSFFVINEWAQ